MEVQRLTSQREVFRAGDVLLRILQRFLRKCHFAQVDTPRDVAARVRFAKYRGLKSWRSSPWDPKENLPREYSRVFAFQNSKRAHKRCVSLPLLDSRGLGVLFKVARRRQQSLIGRLDEKNLLERASLWIRERNCTPMDSPYDRRNKEYDRLAY